MGYPDALLKAVEMAADLLWDDSWEADLPDMLAALGEALGATRVALLPAGSASTGTSFPEPVAGWSSLGENPQVAVQELVSPFLSESRIASWERDPRRAAPLCGPVGNLPSDEKAILEAAGVFSMGVTPVFDGSTCWGLLWVEYSRSPRVWTPEETSALGVVGSLLGATIQNQRLKRAVQAGLEASRELSREERRRYARRLRALHEIDRAILAARLPEEIAQAALERILEIVHCDRASVVLFNPERNQARILALGGVQDTSLAKGQQVPIQYVVAAAHLEQGRPHLIEDLQQEEDLTTLQSQLLAEGVRTYLNVPILSQGELIGTLNLGAERLGMIDADTVEIAHEIADLLSVSIHNARLYEAEKVTRQSADTLMAANLALSRTLDIRDVLDTLLDYLEQLVPYDTANVMLIEGERASVLAMRGYESWTDPSRIRALQFDVTHTSTFQTILSTRKSLLIADTASYPDWVSAPGTEFIRSWVGVPLIAGGRIIGFYSLDKAEPGFFQQTHLQLAEALAAQAAVAIQNARLFEQVRSGRERLQALSQRLVNVQEAERRNVARELHDQIGQLLTGLKLILEMSARTPPERAHHNLEEARELVNELMNRVRELSLDLRPAMLDDLGLLPALLWLIERYTHQTQVEVDFKHSHVEERRFQPEVETAAYRIIQEALTNVARHAGVRQVSVRLWADEYQMYLQVEDRGSGFDPREALAAGSQGGLSGMRERAVLTGGQLVIESQEGQGSLVAAELPLLGRIERRRSQR